MYGISPYITRYYNDFETLVSTIEGDTEYFHVGVGLHQGVLFADDLVICENSRAEVELQLERWRETFESHDLFIYKE